MEPDPAEPEPNKELQSPLKETRPGDFRHEPIHVHKHTPEALAKVGNVPAQQQPLPVARRAFQALPENVTDYYFRGDSACHEAELIGWFRDENRADGPQGRIGLAVSARMFPSLKKHIQRLPAAAWKAYRKDSEADIECADVWNYWPDTCQASSRYWVSLPSFQLASPATVPILRRPSRSASRLSI